MNPEFFDPATIVLSMIKDDKDRIAMTYVMYQENAKVLNRTTKLKDRLIMFSKACTLNLVDVVLWMIRKVDMDCSSKKSKTIPKTILCEHREHCAYQFQMACATGDFKQVKYLKSKLKIVKSEIFGMYRAKDYGGDHSAFSACFYNKHFEILKWMVKEFKILRKECFLEYEDEHCKFFNVLEIACMADRLDIADWLIRRYQLKSDTIFTQNSSMLSTFITVCWNNKLRSAKWLESRLSICPKTYDEMNQLATEVYMRGKLSCLDVSEWLAEKVDAIEMEQDVHEC